jgi:biofilm protein TabA
MIVDLLARAAEYRHLGERIGLGLDFLRDPATARLEPLAQGSENSLRIELAGDDVFALVQRYVPRQSGAAFWEAHRTYIDLQCVIEGCEQMWCAPLEHMQVIQPYDSARDFAQLAPLPQWRDRHHVLNITAGMFAIFTPSDAHMPGLAMAAHSAATGAHEPKKQTIRHVKKIVVKVRLDDPSGGISNRM